MPQYRIVRTLWVFVFTALAVCAQPDARGLVRESIRNGEEAWKKSFSYYCIKDDVNRQFDSSGQVKEVDNDVYDIIPLGDHTSYQVHVEHNGEPVTGSEKVKSQQELREWRSASPALKHRRFEKQLTDRSYMKEVADAFNFRIRGEEHLPTGPAWVVEATPRPGYEAKSRYAHMFPKMRGTLWIDQKDIQWVRADAVATDTVAFGFFIARLAKGSHIILEQMKLPDGTWVPKRIEAKASARTFIFFTHNFEEDITYSRYRKETALTASSGSR